MVILALSLSFCLSSLSIFASVSPTIPLSLSLSVHNFACRRKLNWNAENIAKKELVTCVSQAPAAVEAAASRAKSKSIAEISWPETPLLKLFLLFLLHVACCKSIKLHFRRKQRRLGIASLLLSPLPTSRHFQFVIGHPSEGFDYCSKNF